MTEIQIFLDKKAKKALQQHSINLHAARIVRTALEGAKLIRRIRRHGDDATDFSTGSGIELLRELPLNTIETRSSEHMVVIATVDELRGSHEEVEACRKEIAQVFRKRVPPLLRMRFAVSLRGAASLCNAA